GRGRCRSHPLAALNPTDVTLAPSQDALVSTRRAGGVMFEGQTIRAVLFDLDGTLYHQRPMRAFMALESLTMPLAGLSRASRRWHALLEYRRALELFRHEPPNDPLIAE